MADVERITNGIKGLRNAIRRIRATQLAQGQVLKAIAAGEKADDALLQEMADDLEAVRTEVKGDPAEAEDEFDGEAPPHPDAEG